MKSLFWKGLLGLCPLLLLTGCGKHTHMLRQTDIAMGTVVQQSIYSEDAKDKITDDIIKTIEWQERQVLSRRLDTAWVYQVNERAGSTMAVDAELYNLLEGCVEISKASQGKFDCTLGSVIALWKIDEWAAGTGEREYTLPTEEEIKAALAHTGYQKLVLNGEQVTLPEGYVLDMGAVGKGYTLDVLLELLDNRESVTGATISLGGSILTYGSKPDHSPWYVGVVNPHDSNEQLGVLSLQGQWCVSTSGDYQRFVKVEGNAYHHIIDPSTGYPGESDVKSVTILSKSGFLSDALSTACFLLGSEEGMKLARQYDAEALFVTYRGELVMTEGMQAVFREN